MSVCCCSLVGTGACKYCCNNPDAVPAPNRLISNEFVLEKGGRFLKLTEDGCEVWSNGKKILTMAKDGTIIVPSDVTICGYRPDNPGLTEALNFALLAMKYGEATE